jgi:hypothetical protein
VNEAQFQRQVLQIAAMYGWRVYHTHDSRRSNPGWPDLVLCKPPRVLFVELKSETGRLRLEQAQWLSDLAACGMETDVWRPQRLSEIAGSLGPRGKRLQS